MSAAKARWRTLPTWARVGIAGVIALVAINVGLGLLDGATRGADQSGSRSSSFSTASTGTQGYADLLERYGHPTSRFRGDLAPGDLHRNQTLIVLDAGTPTHRERLAVNELAQTGGEVVIGGPDALSWAGDLQNLGWVDGSSGPKVRWDPNGRRITRADVEDETFRVQTDGAGSWRTPDGNQLTVTEKMPGHVLFLADTSPLQNRRLDEAENAAFGLALAGGDHRPVVFLEGPHGFGSGSGLDVIPGRWKVALVGGALAALLTLIAASRRIGPAEETVRRLPPPRRAVRRCGRHGAGAHPAPGRRDCAGAGGGT